MSWDAYRDNLIATQKVSKAAILGMNDGGVWTHSAGLSITPEQATALRNGFSNSSSLAQAGFWLGDVKYMYIQSDETQIQGKKGTTGASIYKCNQCIVVGIYEDNMQPGNCRMAVERIGEYLKGSGY